CRVAHRVRHRCLPRRHGLVGIRAGLRVHPARAPVHRSVVAAAHGEALMRLVVLGCSGSGPGPDSPASGYLVEAGDARIVLDLGNGTFGALQRHVDPWRLDAVASSHLPPDHCADFTALVVHRRYHPHPPYDAAARPLAVHAPAEAPDRFAAAYAPSAAERAETDLTDVFAFHP